MDNNWIVDNLENALTTWNEKLAEMWTLLTESPQTFKGGTIWSTVTTINGAMLETLPEVLRDPDRHYAECGGMPAF